MGSVLRSTLFCCALTGTAGLSNAALITFDDIPAGFIGDQYLARGVKFLVGNGEHGASTGLQLAAGSPVSAYAGSYGTSVSQPNVMNAGQYLQSDILVQFYDALGNRAYASSAGVTNDADGNPALIYVEGLDVNGNSLGRATINGASQAGTFNAPAIYAAKIWSAPSQNGVIGVDNFTFQLTAVPEPTSAGAALVASVCVALRGRRRRLPRTVVGR